MVTGDPFKFSIMVDVVTDWNQDSTFNNGLLFMGIDGKLLLPDIENITLNVNLYQLIDNLKMISDNEELYHMDKRVAFITIHNLTYPTDWNLDNDYSYDITPFEFGDHNCAVFMVGCGDNVRILGAAGLYYNKEECQTEFERLRDSDIAETYISKIELEAMREKLIEFGDMINKK